MKMKVLMERSVFLFVSISLLNILLIVYLHYEDSISWESFGTRRLSFQENIQNTLHFLHLDSPSTESVKPIQHQDEPISFLEPEKINAHKPSLLSQAISFLDLAVIKAREKLHLEGIEERKKSKATSEIEVESKPPQRDMKKPQLPSTIEFLQTDTVSHLKKPKKHLSQPQDQSSTAQRSGNIHFGGSKKEHKPLQNLLSHVNVNPNIDAAEALVIAAHEHKSPRNGTDISSQNYETLLKCPNQSKCIVPELQLKKKYKVYFCRHPVRFGVRFYFLSREGFLLHPNVEMVSFENIDKADYIIYLPGSAPWHKTECNVTSFGSRLIVLDEFDGHTLFLPTRTKEQYIQNYGSLKNSWYFLYFKRSFVRRTDGKFLGYPHLKQFETYPMTYAVAEAYIAKTFNQEREIEILCTLRGSIHMTTRLRVQNWVAEYGQERRIKNVISSQVDSKDRTTISLGYFNQMRHAKIVVTVNPANWEGDFRLWEAMCTGALIFVDPIFVPHQFPLIDRQHVIFFSNRNRSDLYLKLDYYRQHPEEAKRIALQGYFHAMKYHRTINLVDYILRTAHTREVMIHQKISSLIEDVPDYLYTGQYLNYMAKVQEKMILKCDTPGIYEPFQKVNGTNFVRHLTACPISTY